MRRTGSPRPVALAAIALAVLAAGGPARAEVSVEADLSPEVVAPGEPAVYSVVINDADAKEFSAPDFGKLNARGPSSTVQSSLFMSGGTHVVRTSRILSWTLTCDRSGTFRIGAASLTVDGTTYRTKDRELRCDENAAGTPRSGVGIGRRNPFQPFPANPLDAFDDLSRWGSGTDAFGPRTPGERDLFLRAVVDKTEAYLGEQITLSLYLFSQPEVAGVQTVSFPKLDGFWAEDIEAPTQLIAEIKNIKGIPYRAYMLRRRALFPLRAGELSIDPVEAQVSIGTPLFWGAQPETVKRRSSPLAITIKELPAEGQPPDFEAGHVGDFTMTATATPTNVPLGQPVQLKVVIEGTGNIKALKLPRPALPPGLKTFDPTITDRVKVQAGRSGGTKTLEYVIIPERTGAFVLPPMKLAYFNPREGRYDEATTEEIAIAVAAPGDGAAPMVASGGSGVGTPVATNVLGSGLRPIRLEGAVVAPTPVLPWRRGWFWPLVFVPVGMTLLVGAGGAFAGFVRRGDPEKKKVQRARGTAAKRLKDARALAEGGKAGDFYAAVSHALVTFVTDKTGIAALGLTRDALAQELKARGFADGDVAGLVRLLEESENARFAPLGGSAEARAKVLDEAMRVIDAMDATKVARAEA